jgi:putative ABC transport system substrate-binding protein
LGRSIQVAAPLGGERPEVLEALAADLVSQGVDVLVTVGGAATSAASKATETIPIVMATVGNARGFVTNLAKPERNITGLTLQQAETDFKLLTLLKEAAPAVSRIVVLYGGGEEPRLVSTVRALALEPISVQVPRDRDFEGLLSGISMSTPTGLFVVHNATFTNQIIRKIGLQALEYGLPGAASPRSYVSAGLLLSYTANEPELRRRAASFVDRLLRGAKPRDLPVEQPTKFELAVNLRTARALTLAIPPSLLARADEVIE